MADQYYMSFKSVGGLLSSVLLPSLASIGSGDNQTRPTYSDDHFNEWQCGNWAETQADAYLQWDSYYKPCGIAINTVGDLTTSTNISNYLIAHNHVSEGSACSLAEFKIVDSQGDPVPNVRLALRAFVFPNDTTIRYFLAKGTELNNVWSYTTITSISPMTIDIGSSGARVACGVYTGATEGGSPTDVGYGFGLIGIGAVSHGYRFGGYLQMCNATTLYNLVNGIPEGEPVSPEYGPGSQPGGYGPGGGGSGGPGPTFNGTSDPWVDYPQKPGIAALGLVNLYKCDVGSLVNLGAELFPDINFPTSLSDVGEVIAAVSDSIWNSKLIDYIVSAHIIPVDVDVTGVNLEDIKVGTRTMTGILARKISNDIVEFDCGSVKVDEYYTNFVDYRGTRCKIYIPFYGMVELKPEYWQSATLSLKYLFNVVDGSFIAQLFSEVERHQAPFKAMIGQYTGCACVHVPMTGAEYASMFGGMIANAGGMVSGIATANPAMAATSAVGFAQSTAGGGAQGSNAYNASAGFYGYPCPYLIIERQVSHFSTRYPKEKGLPLLVSKKIGACSGFTVAEDIILDGIACTSDEKERIRNYFKSGVIIRN